MLEKYNCECIECGHKMVSEEHCDKLTCSECGGKMRRVERPGPGQAGASLIISINGAKGRDMGDEVVFESIIAAEGVYSFIDDKTGETKYAYRNAEETRKMIPFCNSLPFIDNHPNDMLQFIGADLKDSEFPVYGYTSNAHEATPGPRGEARVGANIHLMKVDRAGGDRTASINAIESGETGNSIGYFMTLKAESGTFHGKAYTHLETDVAPKHLGRMVHGWKPKCDEPVCGIGQSGEQGSGQMSENQTPPAQGGPEDTTPVLTPEKKLSVAEMCPDAIAEVNPGVNALKAKVGELEKEKEELATKLKDQEKDLEELEQVRAERKKAEEEERKQAVEWMKAKMGPAYDKAFPPEVEPTLDALKTQREILEALPQPDAPESPRPRRSSPA